MKVYIVMGETGEYSDRNEWPVVAYTDEVDAKAHVMRCDAWLLQNSVHANSDTVAYDYTSSGKALINPHDPGFHFDYTGTRYYVIGVQVAEK